MNPRAFWKWLALLVVIAIAGPEVLNQIDVEGLDRVARPRQTTPGDVQRTAMPLCTSGRREPPGGSCVIDGDSGWLEGRQWRLEGVDAPEIGKPECSAERDTGERSKRRLAGLLEKGFTASTGRDDRYGRQLIRFRLADGRDAGEVLVGERLAQRWPNKGNVWCGW